MSAKHIVHIYAIIFNGNRKYMYVGSTYRLSKRFGEHIGMLCNNCKSKFMQNVFNKHGIDRIVVFKRVTDEQHRLSLEQEYYDFFARHGWTLVNAVPPVMSMHANYEFEALAETTAKRSAGQKRRFEQNPQLHAERSTNVHNANLRMWANEEKRMQRVQALRNRKNPERTRQRRALLNKFRAKYGTLATYKYDKHVGSFEPWMHFIIQNDLVTAFAWDTRQVQFTCKVNDLPVGYARVKTTLEPYTLLNY